jgi:hypothetical protein
MNSGMYGSGMYGYGNGMYGYGNGMYGNGMYGAGGSWMYNPYFGMYTFMPFNGTAFSPFGYAYYTPITVVPVYAYTPVQGGGGAPVTKVGPGRGTPGTGGPVHSALPVRTTPALTSSASMHTSAITRGAGGSSHVGFTGGNGNYGGGYSGNSSYSGTSTANNSVSNSVSSAPARSAGGGGAASSGGGGATRTH